MGWNAYPGDLLSRRVGCMVLPGALMDLDPAGGLRRALAGVKWAWGSAWSWQFVFTTDGAPPNHSYRFEMFVPEFEWGGLPLGEVLFRLVWVDEAAFAPSPFARLLFDGAGLGDKHSGAVRTTYFTRCIGSDGVFRCDEKNLGAVIPAFWPPAAGWLGLYAHIASFDAWY